MNSKEMEMEIEALAHEVHRLYKSPNPVLEHQLYYLLLSAIKENLRKRRRLPTPWSPGTQDDLNATTVVPRID